MRLFGFLLFAAGVWAQDAGLEGLRATLAVLRSHADEADQHDDTRGARPELTIAKHQLRDWVESRLSKLSEEGDERVLEIEINKQLQPLLGTDIQELIGTVGAIQLRREDGLLILTTGVGILCGFDQSAYAYSFYSDHWQRVWESERNDYSMNRYLPQDIEAVHVSGPFGDRQKLVLTLGKNSWCTSNLQPVYYRVWRVDFPNAPVLLIDESDHQSYVGVTIPIQGSVDGRSEPAEVLVEYRRLSIDTGVHNRAAIRHYVINGNSVRRIDPVALSPRDFVDEWLVSPWAASSAWSYSAALRTSHRQLHSDFVFGEFDMPTMHCQTPDLWQVSLTPQNSQKNFEEQPKVYFLVRWRPPYHFTMMNVSDKPWPRCNQPDPEADEWRTLFPSQE